MAQPQGMFDWNYQDPRLLQQQYAQQGQLSPAEMAQLPLLNQVAAMGSNAGANIGVGLGRMFGGRAPQEIENEVMKDVFTQAAQATADPIERLQIAAQGLRQKGMEGRAVQLERQMFEMQEMKAKAQQAQTKATDDKTASEAEQQAFAGRTQFVKRKMPDLTDTEAQAIAADKEAVRKLLSDPAMKTQVVESNGRSLLINSATGETIKDLGSAPERGTRVNVGVSPVIKQATDIAGQMSSFQKLTEPQREMLRSAETAKSMINEAAKANNSQAWEAARTQVAKAIGESKLSNEDIRRTGVDPRLVQGALDWVNKKIEGVPNQDIMKQLFVVASLLEKTSTDRINATATQARNVARSVGMEGDIDLLFPTVGSGTSQGNVVDWSTLK
jgi:hypothetical protein